MKLRRDTLKRMVERGEVVVVGEHFGVRITRVLHQGNEAAA